MARPQGFLPNGLPQNHRFITDHDAEGKSIFSSAISESQAWTRIDDTANFALNYTTSHNPVSLKNNEDIDEYKGYLEKPPGLVIPRGSVLRFVDISPGAVSPMHRTVSLDYGVVIEGQVWLELDSGDKRLMRRGDVAIQRGTNHAWRNASSTESARMMYVLLESEPIDVGGKLLGEALGTMTGVRGSG